MELSAEAVAAASRYCERRIDDDHANLSGLRPNSASLSPSRPQFTTILRSAYGTVEFYADAIR